MPFKGSNGPNDRFIIIKGGDMGKTNWTRVFLGGLLAGFVSIVLAIVVDSIYLYERWLSVADNLGLLYQR